MTASRPLTSFLRGTFQFSGLMDKQEFWRFAGLPFLVVVAHVLYALTGLWPSVAPQLAANEGALKVGVAASFASTDGSYIVVSFDAEFWQILALAVCVMLCAAPVVRRARDGGNRIGLIPVLLILGPVLVIAGKLATILLLLWEWLGLAVLIGLFLQWPGFVLAAVGPIILTLWMLHDSYTDPNKTGPNPNEVPQ